MVLEVLLTSVATGSVLGKYGVTGDADFRALGENCT